MASIFFKGRIDFDLLSMSDISEITAAIASLQSMAKKHGFDFVSGPSRRGVPRPDAAGSKTIERPKAQRRLLLTLLSHRKPMSLLEIAETTGLKEGTINPHLSSLYADGLINKNRVRKEETDRVSGPRSITTYALTVGGIEIAEKIQNSGHNLLE